METDFNEIPITNELIPFYYRVQAVRDLIKRTAVTDSGKVQKVPPDTVEHAIDSLFTPQTLEILGDWNRYRAGFTDENGNYIPGLRDAMFRNVLGSTALVGMLDADPDRIPKKVLKQLVGEATTQNLEKAVDEVKGIVDFSPRIKIYIRTEGRYNIPGRSTIGSGFARGQEVPISKEVYGLDDLILHWKDIFPTPEAILNNPDLRDKFAPICEHEGKRLTAIITSIQYQMRVVEDKGKKKGWDYKEGTSMVFFREQFGHMLAGKLVEYLVGVRANGKPRNSLDDFIGQMLIVPDAKGMWNKVYRILRSSEEIYNANFENAITLRDYRPENYKQGDEETELVGLMKKYFLNPENRTLRSNLREKNFKYENSRGGKDKCAEIKHPITTEGGHGILQVYRHLDHTRMEGDHATNHLDYKRDQEELMLKGWSYLHRAAMEKVYEKFVNPYMVDFYKKCYYEGFLSPESIKRDYERQHPKPKIRAKKS